MRWSPPPASPPVQRPAPPLFSPGGHCRALRDGSPVQPWFPYYKLVEHDQEWMREALRLARLGGCAGEVPVGAVAVWRGEIVAGVYNAPVSRNDPTAHAEILALRQAAERIGNYRLEGVTLVCTLEPCAMCAGALVAARIERLVFGTRALRLDRKSTRLN